MTCFVNCNNIKCQINLHKESERGMKKRIVLVLCSLLIACGGFGMSTLTHEELPVSEMLLAEATMKDPEEALIEEIIEEKTCIEGCTLEEGHEGDCVLDQDEIEVILKSTSMERDLKIKFVSKASGKVISGADFKMKLTSPSKKTKEYSDHDQDGIIWVKDIDGGNYTVEMVELEGYTTAQKMTAEVKNKIEYKVVEIIDEVKKESEVVVSQEDAAYGGTDKDESTSSATVLADTVEYVESSRKEVVKETSTQKKDSFGQPMYEKQKKDALGQLMYAKIISESEEFHTYAKGTCTRCGATKTAAHVHGDTNNDCVCDGAECKSAMHSELSNGVCNKCKQIIKAEEHEHKAGSGAVNCDGCKAAAEHTCADSNNDCVCDGAECESVMHSELTNGVCDKCKQVINQGEHTHEAGNSAVNCDGCKALADHTCVDAEDNSDGKCDICSESMPASIEEVSSIVSMVFRKVHLLAAADTKARFIEYDTDSAPVYDTSSAKVYETETTYIYTGWQNIDGATYYFDKNGNKVTGQQVIQGISYTFSSEGVRSGTIGIDVSKYQPSVDWKKVKNAGINFVMIRCGYRGYGSGVLVEDPLYRSHITGAKAAGLRVGVYFFSQAVNEAEAVEEASMAVSLAKKYGINMPIAIDSEYAAGGSGRADRLSKSERTAVTKAFCDTVKSAGYTPMVYASKSWFSDHLNVSQLSGYRIWVAHYANQCGYKGTYHIWQNTDKGKVDGIPGHVDMNISSI